VPLGLHHPVWIEDPDFDLDRHVKTMRLAPPGGPAEMDAAISEFASVPLARDRPLWEIAFFEGFADGRIPVVAKIHHALADGVAAAAMLATVVGAPVPAPAPAAWRPDALPATSRLVGDAFRDHLVQIRRLPGLVRHTAQNLRRTVRERGRAQIAGPRPILDTPRTLFNGALTARRTFVSTTMPLADVKAVKNALGVTVNDVLLAMVAGSLRSYLQERHALPAESLVAEVPVATDAPGVQRRTGNRLSNIFTSLRTDLDDPVARIRAIHDVTQAVKALHEALGPDLYESWSQYAPPRLFAGWMRFYSGRQLANRYRPAINVIVSSVPGPRAPLAWPSGRLDAIFSVGPIIEGTALNVTAWSYADHLHVGVLACPDLVPDVPEIAAGLHRELVRLGTAGAAGQASESGAAPAHVASSDSRT
jgi:diacylglycerol O-acyltransferase / wax synthase